MRQRWPDNRIGKDHQSSSNERPFPIDQTLQVIAWVDQTRGAMKTCYKDWSFEKKSPLRKRDLCLSGKNTFILTPKQCILIRTVSLKKEFLMDSNIFQQRKLSKV
jgi:hypothetical protein